MGITRQQHEAKSAPFDKICLEMQRQGLVQLIDLSPRFFPNGSEHSQLILNDTVMYRDGYHLSNAGSLLFTAEIKPVIEDISR